MNKQSEQNLFLNKAHDYCAVKNPKLTVICVHGISADWSSFEKALDYLESIQSLKEIRFIAFDLLGSGKSYKNDELNYDYKEQLTALHNSIEKLEIDTPVVLVGHSMGTLIVTRYANTYKKTIDELILISPPVYTEKDLSNPAFLEAIKVFRDVVALKNKKVVEEKPFKNSMEYIVLNKNNYRNLVELKTRAILIYGDKDQLIAAQNIPKVVKENDKYLSAIKTVGRHGVSRDKYSKMVAILEEVLNAKNI
ncbi:alpha/beta hydrolase [Candidatus Saccharibacteria bacterium]|nr:alpha/beta hydrolase [Candidatus Saccharibacteria bacterium]